jgi:hypothetical protein
MLQERKEGSMTIFQDKYTEYPSLTEIYNDYVAIQLRNTGMQDLSLLLNIEGAIHHIKFAGVNNSRLFDIARGTHTRLAAEKMKGLPDVETMTLEQAERLVIHQLMTHMVFVGIPYTNPIGEAKLYSASIEMLVKLFDNGQLENEDTDIDRIKRNLFTRMEKALKETEDGVPVYRLDLVSVSNGKPEFKAVVPTGIFQFHDSFLVPMNAYGQTIMSVANVFKKNIVRVMYRHTNGAVSNMLVTCDSDVISEVFEDLSEENRRILTSRLEESFGQFWGYDLWSFFDYNRLRVRAVDLNGSIHSGIVKGLRLECIDMLSKGDISEVDRTMHTVDVNLACDAFCSRIRRMTGEQLDTLNLFTPLDGFATVRDKKEALLTWGTKPDNIFKLYTLMKATPAFGDVDKAMANMQQRKRKFLKNFDSVPLATNEKDRVFQLRDYMKSGTLKMQIISKKGGLYERICTLNEDILEAVYGENWRGDLESPRTRLEYFQNAIVANDITTEDIEKLITKLDVSHFLDMNLFRQANAGAREIIVQNAIDELKHSRNFTPKPEMITARSVEARVSSEFYVSFDVNLVQKAEFAPWVAPKKASSTDVNGDSIN